MGLRAGLDWCGKSRPTGIRSPDRPVRRQSLYRLRYPAHKRRVLVGILYFEMGYGPLKKYYENISLSLI